MNIRTLKGYDDFLRDLKSRIRTAQTCATLAVNRELVLLYWQIGRDILTRQKDEGWGAKVIERLANDLRKEFPDMKGFSRANLMYMRSFAEAWDDELFVQQLVGQIPWGAQHSPDCKAEKQDRARMVYPQNLGARLVA